MTFLKSLFAWIAKTPKEVIAMSDEIVEPVAVEVAPVIAVVVAAPIVVESAVNTDTLKAVLTALGHDLDAVWADAIALAKKAL